MTSPSDIPPGGRLARIWERVRHPNREHVEKLRTRVPLWFVALVLFGFALLQIVLNPFGFSDLTQRYAQDVSNLLITGPYLYPTTGRDQVSVALIEEDTLHTLQMPWPWNYSAHKQALDAILAYKPRAVIVDFLFVDSRPDASLPDLVDEIARYKKAGVPLYFEGGTDLPYGESPLRPELADTGVPILDPTIDVYDGVVRQYPVSGYCYKADGQVKDASCPSLALRVFADVYPNIKLAPLNGKIELVWGTRTEPTNLKWRKYRDDDGTLHPCSVETNFVARTWRAFFDKSTAQGHCPYDGIVPVEALIRGDDDPDIARLLTNRVVFYGAALKGAQDTSYTPVNGLQANVFVHAMAMDNLITFRGRPYQNVMTVWGTTFSNEPAQVMAIVPVILVLSFLHLRRIRARRRGRRAEHNAVVEWFLDKGVENVWHWLAFFLALGIGLLLALWVGLSVANWVEDVFISVELAAMLLIGVPDSFWGYLHHVAGGRPDEPNLEVTA
ncbi:MAG TPA: CHASE2 domain-containing protein [Rhizomicrobium sp.]|nr:CHASE2 domain-containing protein [Rhizomicrobium sp.]